MNSRTSKYDAPGKEVSNAMDLTVLSLLSLFCTNGPLGSATFQLETKHLDEGIVKGGDCDIQPCVSHEDVQPKA